MAEFTEAELAGLSEEERRAVLEEDDETIASAQDEDPEAEESEEPGDEPEAESSAADEEEGDGDEAAVAAAEGSEEGQEEKAAKKEETPKPTPSRSQGEKTFVPTYTADETQLESIQNKLLELDQKIEDGDIDIVEYTRQRDPLIRQQTKIEMVQVFNEQQSEQLWKHEQTVFFNQYPDYKTDPVMNGALRSVFKQLDTSENASKSGYELLQEAREIVDKRMGVAPPASQATANDKASIPRSKTPAREGANIPKTLSGTIPAAENVTAKDEFAHLDKLEGVEYEMALAKLSPEQERRYLGGI
jgi:hypothetical protein